MDISPSFSSRFQKHKNGDNFQNLNEKKRKICICKYFLPGALPSPRFEIANE